MILNNLQQDNQSENYPLRLIQHELKKRKLDFVIEWGIRTLLTNGDFFGVTTTLEWNELLKNQTVINQSKEHYLIEFSNVLQNNMMYVIRNKDLANNPFLLTLAEVEVCNGLGVYTTNHIGIVGYFFTAKHDDSEAVNFFVNNLTLFRSIINDVDRKLIEIGYWNNVIINSYNQKLFDINDRRLIFGHKKLINYPSLTIVVDGQLINLSSRQVETLCLLKESETNKDLAYLLNIERRTTEWYLTEIRKKIGLQGCSKTELVHFASKHIKI